MKVGTHSGVRHQDGRDFFYLLFKMQRITDFLKENDVESDALKKYRQRLTNLHKEATLAYKSHGHEISRSTLDDFLKMRNLVVIGRKEEKVARLLRDANTFKEQFDSDKVGHRKKRVPLATKRRKLSRSVSRFLGMGSGHKSRTTPRRRWGIGQGSKSKIALAISLRVVCLNEAAS